MKDKLCIASTAPFDKINRAQTNRSTTKQTFSFSKSHRFNDVKPQCPEVMYGDNSLISKKVGTKMGKGSRSDFTRSLNASPSSDKYNLKTLWQVNAQKSKGPKFALSRDKVIFSDYLPKKLQTFPSPSLYDINNKITHKSSPKFSLREKTKLPNKRLTIQAQNSNPGPGTYQNPSLIRQHSLGSISKFQNITYSQSQSKRFTTAETITPGPGKYDDIAMMAKRGNYVLSQNKGGTKGKFDASKRESVFERVYRKAENPGPGSYQHPSQFGHYDGDIYNELRSLKKVNTGWPPISQPKI